MLLLHHRCMWVRARPKLGAHVRMQEAQPLVAIPLAASWCGLYVWAVVVRNCFAVQIVRYGWFAHLPHTCRPSCQL
jgi:hypothetical protein